MFEIMKVFEEPTNINFHNYYYHKYSYSKTNNIESNIEKNTDNMEPYVLKLAAEARVCLRTWWKRMWRLHVAVTRESVKRVLALGSVNKAMQNTSLVFFINAYHSQLQSILDCNKAHCEAAYIKIK